MYQLGPVLRIADFRNLTDKDSYVTRIRVVLAEDHPEMALHLRALLASDYHVRVVSDGRALMAAVDLENARHHHKRYQDAGL